MQKEYNDFDYFLKGLEHIHPTMLNALKALIYKHFLTKHLKKKFTLQEAKKIAHKFTLTILNFKNWQMYDVGFIAGNKHLVNKVFKALNQ